jgi:hypothetical protein
MDTIETTWGEVSLASLLTALNEEREPDLERNEDVDVYTLLVRGIGCRL